MDQHSPLAPKARCGDPEDAKVLLGLPHQALHHHQSTRLWLQGRTGLRTPALPKEPLKGPHPETACRNETPQPPHEAEPHESWRRPHRGER